MTRAARSVGTVAAAFMLPPLGLHLAAARRRDFWIGTGLTILGVVPGIVFALYALSRRGTPVGG